MHFVNYVLQSISNGLTYFDLEILLTEQTGTKEDYEKIEYRGIVYCFLRDVKWYIEPMVVYALLSPTTELLKKIIDKVHSFFLFSIILECLNASEYPQFQSLVQGFMSEDISNIFQGPEEARENLVTFLHERFMYQIDIDISKYEKEFIGEEEEDSDDDETQMQNSRFGLGFGDMCAIM